ncbi:MAG: hypothetical protein Q8904_14670 [Bacteroidota bacterium]|nr:hypothetical protein [Bacteroidota bacterium]
MEIKPIVVHSLNFVNRKIVPFPGAPVVNEAVGPFVQRPESGFGFVSFASLLATQHTGTQS